MLFKQRKELSYWERFKLWLWPRVSWRRSARYYLKRILRLSGTPYAIAIGAAIGAGVAFTPFLGFHLLIIAAVAPLLRGNIIAGAIASCVGNPITFPFIWASTYQLGHLILNRDATSAPPQLRHDLLYKSWGQLWPVIEPMTVGSIPLGIAVGVIVYLVVHKAVSAYRESRSRRFAGRRQQAGNPAE
jgi:uncharacterized protein (DUF2062 family)